MRIIFCVIVVFFSVMLSSCFPGRKLSESQHLLVKNKIIADKKEIPVDNIRYAVRPQTNRRALGLFLWKVGIYQSMIPNEKPYYNHFKRKIRNTLGKYPVLLDTATNDYHAAQFNKFRYWIQNTLGEPPVLLDSSLIDYSLAQIKLMTHNMGYFNAAVNYTVKMNEKRAKVFYYITAGEPYRINEISYQVSEPIDHIIYQDTVRSQVKRGDIFSTKNIEDLRDRMERRVLNAGYFNFSKNYIRCDVDTNLGGQLLNLKFVVSNPIEKIDDSTLVEKKYRCYKINAINVLYNLSPNDNIALADSVHYTEIVKKTKDTNNYIVFYPPNQKNYRPSALIYPIFFSPGDIYSNRSSRNTYDRYADMQNFNFIKVFYAETRESKENSDQDTGYLNCQIQLSRSKKQSIGWELLGKYSGGVFGVGGELSYRNKNLFKSAEILSFSLKYMQEVRVDSSKTIDIQNFELGGNIRLDFPRFLFPIKQQNIPKEFRPKTWMNLGSNFVRRETYSRFLIGYIFAYEWSERKTQQRVIRHSLSVLDFNLIKMYTSNAFTDSLVAYGFSTRIMEKYKDHFLLGTNYQIMLEDAKRHKFWVRFDLFGNTLYGLFRAFGNLSEKYKNAEKQYTIWGIPFASGITIDMDYAYNILQNKKSALVYHAALGIGLPIMNSSELPFEKSFYLGGSNSMRGWRLRSLGPGSYVDTTKLDIEKVGDIKLEMNLEFRHPIYKRFHFGLFVDAGNIWLMKKHDALPNAEFAFNRFFKEIAVNTGVGLRLDLSFVVIRLDYAIKIHDPARQDNTWTFKNWKEFKDFYSDGAFVLGIGYAF